MRILSLFPISKPVTIDETEDLDKQESVTKDGLFTICLKAEEQQATLNNYRFLYTHGHTGRLMHNGLGFHHQSRSLCNLVSIA